MRDAQITRTTSETAISVSLSLDGSGTAKISTGIGFFDHMLDQLAKHALMDMTISAKGDLHIDDHHTVEDVGIAIGQALAKALGDKKGIRRYGHFALAMDDAHPAEALGAARRQVFRNQGPQIPGTKRMQIEFARDGQLHGGRTGILTGTIGFVWIHRRRDPTPTAAAWQPFAARPGRASGPCPPLAAGKDEQLSRTPQQRLLR